MSRLRPFFKYYGSKYTLAPKYPAPKHRVLIEPFAGSAQYATLHHTHDVLLVEIDPEIAELWRWLIAAHPSDIRNLPVELEEGRDIRDLDVPRGGQLLIRASQRVGRSNCWTVSKWNGTPGQWGQPLRDRTAAQVSAIRHWRVHDRSIVGTTSTPPATWFIDPPYQSQPRVYGQAPDFGALGAWCQALPGQVIVCEAPGADWLPFRYLAHNTAGRTKQGGTRSRRQELVWTNDR